MPNEDKNTTPESKNEISPACCSEEWGIRVSAHIDGELPPAEAIRVEEHLIECAECAHFAREIRKIKGITMEMKLSDLPDSRWKVYNRQIYNRIEKGIGWIFTSIGFLIVLSFGLFCLFRDFFGDPDVSMFIKIGVATLGFGLLVLLISACREALFRYKGDRYKEVEL